MTTAESNILFHEEQRFRQWWLILLVGSLAVLIPFITVFGYMRTEVRSDDVCVQYFPFHFSQRCFSFESIASVSARTYDPLSEYGGWGLRGNERNGAFNVSGNRGVQLVFRNGNRLLIGSQRADELASAIRSHRAGFVEVQRNMQWWMLLIGLLPICIAALFIYMVLIVEVRTDGLYARFVPFHLRFLRFPYNEIRSAEARTYNSILEYGGWGIRGWGKNKAYNVSGNQGVQLEFTDGRRLLIGSKNADELSRAIQTAISQQ